MTRFGLGASYRYILTVPVRKTRRLYSTPVDVIEVGGDRWPYFDANPGSPDDAIAAELELHAVFRLAPEMLQANGRWSGRG
jgi:hypothetical protein